MTDRPDPFSSVACELLRVLAERGTPMSLRELEDGSLGREEAVRQLSVARLAGFVRTVSLPDADEPSYTPTTLGWMIARRSSRTSRARTAAAHLRRSDPSWAH